MMMNSGKALVPVVACCRGYVTWRTYSYLTCHRRSGTFSVFRRGLSSRSIGGLGSQTKIGHKKNNKQTESTIMTTTTPKLSDPLTLPTCGVTLPNRIAKAAMTEGLATPDGMATPQLSRLYRLWSDGGAGLLLSGNILVDRDHLERPGNVVLHGGLAEDEKQRAALQAWTKAATHQGNHFWAQLSHGGRQVQTAVNPNPKAPSAVPLNLPGGKFGSPVAMTADEIEAVVEAFAAAAHTCQETGFTGVQIHAAHGYLLSSFLNPKANQRDDAYAGSLANRAKVLLEVVERVRAKVGPTFPICVKLNSADFQKGGFQFEESLQVAQWLEKAGVDMIEISGGNYEQGVMMNLPGMEERHEQTVDAAPSTIAREAYFLDFATAMQKVVTVPLMVTGGFRTKAAMDHALASGGADVIGIGRPLCGMPDGPRRLLSGTIESLPLYENNLDIIPRWLSFLKRFQMMKMINSFASIFWYYEQLEELGQTGQTKERVHPIAALIASEKRSKEILGKRTKGKTASVRK